MEKTIYLKGKIDTNNSAETEQYITEQLSGDCNCVVIDAEKLEYISSAGLRVLLRVKKQFDSLKIINVKPEVYDIFEVTGFTEMITIEKAYRRISVDGCMVIGEGENGKVYRLDSETAVKTYKNSGAIDEIRHEREMARLALILGIPTAISYDIVKVDDTYGAVFELLDPKSFSSILAHEPEKFDLCVKEYVALLKKLHTTQVPKGKLPAINDRYIRQLDYVMPLLPPKLSEKLSRLTKAVPVYDTMIHGDFHTKNIIVSKGETIIIDMDTLSVGHPVFELAQIYNCFVGYSEYNNRQVMRFQGFPYETSRRFWKCCLSLYLETDDEERLTETENKIRCLSYLKLLGWSMRHHDPENPDHMAERTLWVGELKDLLTKVDSFEFETD